MNPPDDQSPYYPNHHWDNDFDPPLNGGQIEDSYSAGATVRACRNARVIRWLVARTIGEQDDIARFLAGHLQCPFDEITLDPTVLDDEILDWIYVTFGAQIDRPTP